MDPHLTSFIRSMSSAQFLGTWDHDATKDQVLLDADAAALMTGDRGQGGKLISLSLAFHTLHEEEAAWLFPRLAVVSNNGGDFIADYRVHTSNGVRRILDCGTFSKQSDGTSRGFGILLDITDIRRTDSLPEVENINLPKRDLLHSINGLQTDLGLRSRRAAVLFDMLRTEVGRLGSDA
ncbi:MULTISPECIES: hypothetical protein [Methylobacteriaceae]|uniref:hypothetical protein n=1 Tax=Methylobacteriaceae TaxID=119045 RepID=UPI002F357B34